MKRAHRTFHRLLWPLLALALVIGVAAALILRPPPQKSATIAAGIPEARA